MHEIETIVVGAGVVGLAVARALSMTGHEVVVLEQHKIIGSETSARNSEVIHAGIYYPEGSLKAQTCVEGKKLLYDFCDSHGVPYDNIGKIIVATNDAQLAALEGIQKHAIQNGVCDLMHLNKHELNSLEPALEGVAGLLSPSTGIIDSHSYMLALQGDAEAHGAQIAFNTRVESWRYLASGGFELTSEDGTNITCQNLVMSAGLHTANLLNAQLEIFEFEARGAVPQPVQYAKGNYFKLAGKAPFSRLIYPVPEPGGLGVHLTLDLGKQTRFGPDVEWVDKLDYEVDPKRADKFYDAIRSYWPKLPDNSLEPDYSGIRPKLSGPDEPNADFMIRTSRDHGISGLTILAGIESPGLTASLALAEHIEQTIKQ